ncbi:GNAT family N-acetyltransferase [Weissella bombi]|uniref:Ribosomal protein S18 acetylase RimI n=1 Tax=Weissella bombi TaxID=1505725 RepID=A0A1C3ZJD5_9LACO|nr:GNAT family N-acetyltransferase [Weissella bombi]SCB82448.1 Ribosomal protein S18 acetylase RimI [Weissella bombi]
MIAIKQITLSELPELQKISRQTFLDTFGSDNSAANMKAYLDHAYGDEPLTKELTDPNSFFFFAEDNQQILGYLKLNINQAQTETQGPTALEIERIYVNKAFKHQGLGTKLFQKAIEVAKYHGKSEIWLGVWENNAAALKFYHKLGFEQIGDHVFQLGDDPQRDLIMLKKL